MTLRQNENCLIKKTVQWTCRYEIKSAFTTRADFSGLANKSQSHSNPILKRRHLNSGWITKCLPGTADYPRHTSGGTEFQKVPFGGGIRT